MPRSSILLPRSELITDRASLNAVRAAIASEQNLMVQSEDFASASWVKDATTVPTVTSNQIANPINGAIDADLLSEATVTIGIHRIYQGLFTLLPDTWYTLSVFMRNNNRRYGVLSADGITDFAVVADLQAGTISDSVVNNGTSNYVSLTPAIESWGNGWYRVSATVFCKKRTQQFLAIATSGGSSVSNVFHAGESKSIYLWGAQLVNANWPGPYVKTQGSVLNTGRLRNIVM